MDATAGAIINLTVDGEQFDLLEEDSVDFDAGESINDFELAAKQVSESFHEVASPTLDFTTALDSAAAAGIEALGITDADGNYQTAGSRRVEDVSVEYLDGDEGTVEFTLDIPAATAEFESADSQNPLVYSVTLHVNETPVFTPPESA